MRMLLLALLLGATQAYADISSILNIENAVVRQPMPGRSVTAAYFTLRNVSNAAITISGASSSYFARVELHQHTHKDGMMRMERLDDITVGAGEVLQLAPGGLHLMMFEPLSVLEIGQTVSVTLYFSDDQQYELEVPVVATPKR